MREDWPPLMAELAIAAIGSRLGTAVSHGQLGLSAGMMDLRSWTEGEKERAR